MLVGLVPVKTNLVARQSRPRVKNDLVKASHIGDPILDTAWAFLGSHDSITSVVEKGDSFGARAVRSPREALGIVDAVELGNDLIFFNALPLLNIDFSDAPNEAKTLSRLNYAMSNSFAFGGTGAALILKKIN